MALGCSSDDSGSSETGNGLLVKSISYTTYDEGITHTDQAELNYSGNVLESVLNPPNKKIEFVYSGNKVTETKHYVDDVLSRTNTYSYDGDLLASVTSNDGEQILYSYNGNVLSEMTYQLFDGSVWNTYETESYVFSQNNLIQKTQTNFLGETYESRTTYDVDDKNNPTKNMNPYLRMTLVVPGIHPMSNNNATLALVYSPSSSTTPTSGYTYEMVYNPENYPTSIIVKEGDTIISETTIEYQ